MKCVAHDCDNDATHVVTHLRKWIVCEHHKDFIVKTIHEGTIQIREVALVQSYTVEELKHQDASRVTGT